VELYRLFFFQQVHLSTVLAMAVLKAGMMVVMKVALWVEMKVAMAMMLVDKLVES
jgi:hypothetical protein